MVEAVKKALIEGADRKHPAVAKLDAFILGLPEGTHRLDRCLYIHANKRPSGITRTFGFRYHRHGSGHGMRLGSCGDVSVATAIATAAEYRGRMKLDESYDPLADKRQQAEAVKEQRKATEAQEKINGMTFKRACELYMRDADVKWSTRTARIWEHSFRDHCWPHFGDLLVNDVDDHHIIDCLDPPEGQARDR
jgi:hypothetical protein